MSRKPTDSLPGLGPRSAVPKIVPGLDWRTIQLDSGQGYVLSRIDGRTRLHDICLLAPFPEEETIATLTYLHQNGLIDIPGLARYDPPNVRSARAAAAATRPAPERPAPRPSFQSTMPDVRGAPPSSPSPPSPSSSSSTPPHGAPAVTQPPVTISASTPASDSTAAQTAREIPRSRVNTPVQPMPAVTQTPPPRQRVPTPVQPIPAVGPTETPPPRQRVPTPVQPIPAVVVTQPDPVIEATGLALGQPEPARATPPPPTQAAPAAEGSAPSIVDGEEVELGADMLRRIDEMIDRVGRASPFALLEIPPGVDKKELRRAYFRLSKEFHPDRYYGKKLGPYGRKLQQVFAALSSAFEELSDDGKREAAARNAR